ncbi:HK97 gp10 family phage protein [Chelativorans sp. ZYF759]|uniref:HK97-gp10 family putative phage morphogenesis protein n=1 Tax=Chelativorans sp. ZYF759 TaxID=2692213 RepID=UPI00145DF2DB|nr:HK97-gp10 family putative phage morphogenesis protein [Chelativorans sp. ZYF759]NMG39888.1 HK97 gp10 family phage protein [Chelativorans sp. ZYF759]
MAKVQGLDRLKRKLTQSIPQRAKAVTRQAMEKSAEEIVKSMRQLVPVKTGRLRDSIGWTWGDAPEGAVVVGSSAPVGAGTMKITIYAGIRGNNNYDQGFYVRFIEFGTQAMAAQPFFFPAYRLNKKRSANRIKRAIRKGVKEAMQG